MARLRGIAETALASEDPAVLREALADCLEESDRVVESRPQHRRRPAAILRRPEDDDRLGLGGAVA